MAVAWNGYANGKFLYNDLFYNIFNCNYTNAYLGAKALLWNSHGSSLLYSIWGLESTIQKTLKCGQMQCFMDNDITKNDLRLDTLE